MRLTPVREANMRPNTRVDKLALGIFRKRIETPHSQFEAMVLARLRPRTNHGLEPKVHATVLAATLTNAG